MSNRRRQPERVIGGPGTRERLLSEVHEVSAGSSRALFGIGFAILLFAFLLCLSASQATEHGPATNVLKSGIASVTEIDTILYEHLPEMRQAADAGASQTVGLPGYPLSVSLSANEVTSKSEGQVRELLLQRSADLVYAKGLSAFSPSGGQSLGTFSSQGLLKLGVGQLSADSHDRAHLFTLIFGGLAAAFAVGVLLANNGLRRLRSLAAATIGGALPVLLVTLLARLIVDGIGGGDAYTAELRSIADAVLDVPIRNGSVVAVLGLVLVVLVLVLEFAERRFAPRDYWSDPTGYEIGGRN